MAHPATADTVSLGSGEEVKGIIVEEYTDRIVISTYEGEKTIFKEKISKTLYDLTEQNLVKLGDKYMSRQEPAKAYFYYEKAHNLNPGYKEASDKMNHVLGQLFRKSSATKRREVEKREEISNWQMKTLIPKENFTNKLEKHIGMRIAEEAGAIKIRKVIKNSPAFKSGLEVNDALVSVWGRFTGYMSEEEVAEILLKESLGEIKMAIRREIILKKKPASKSYPDIIGGKLDMLMDGLTIVALDDGRAGENSGLARDDLIVAINGASTRYMPLKDAVGMIEDKAKKALTFSVRRDVTIWKGT
jgi:C-terminal processing protease CtpA/Prc